MFQVIEELGSGAFADVFKVKSKNLQVFYAIKVVRDDVTEDDQKRAQFLPKLVHENIVRTFQVGFVVDVKPGVKQFVAKGSSTTCKFGELLELCDTDLHEKLQLGRQSDSWCRSTLAQVCGGLEYLHSRRIVHADLKPANILLKGVQVKLADFGQSVFSTRYTMSGIQGSYYYMPPEVRKGGAITPSTDIYSLGVIMMQMFCTVEAFARWTELLDPNEIEYDTEMPVECKLPPKLVDLLVKMTNDPANRPSASVVRKAMA